MGIIRNSIFGSDRANVALDLASEGMEKLRAFTAGLAVFGATDAEIADGAVKYFLSPDFIRTFATAGFPFLTYYEFNELSGWYRDTYFAPEHVDAYNAEAGNTYTVWTHDATSSYRRHLFLDHLEHDLTLSFQVPFLDAASWFPLRIRLYDAEGLYFQNDQKLVVERLSPEGATLTSWRKLPNLRGSLERLRDRNISMS
ncbi:MAG: hypothetical protein AAGL89_15585 [Pseudomonadota bacterium]